MSEPTENEESTKQRIRSALDVFQNYTTADGLINATKLTKDVTNFRAALEKIACYSQGETVTSSFDEPHAARIAREALETKDDERRHS